MGKLRIIVMGIIGQAPFAGIAWQALHYLEGFRRLGHDVYYLEDTGSWPYDPEANRVTDDCSYAVDYIHRVMSWGNLDDRWAYRSVGQDRRVFGLADSQLAELLRHADVLVNLTAATVLRDEHLKVPTRVYLETDPVLPQIEVAQGRERTIKMLSAHTHHFTFAENLGSPDCGLPSENFDYRPTRQPIVLDWWANADRPSSLQEKSSRNGHFTTVANWQQTEKDIEWRGEVYSWSKHHEFLKFVDLPRHTKQAIELALSSVDDQTVRSLKSFGWKIHEALPLSKEISTYRDYIRGSRGEFTVAKDQNVRLRTGWFSDRSACYLAAGRPVVTQDTGFGSVLPTGVGLFAFKSMEEILGAFEAINADYEKHSRAASAIAEEYFKAETVLAKLLSDLGF